MDKKPSRPAAVILATIVGLAVAYPLSAGPAVLLATHAQANWRPERAAVIGKAFGTIYEPLSNLPDPIVTPLQKWTNLWLRLAPGDVQDAIR